MTLRLTDIQIRDPFVVPVPDQGYLLFGSTDKNIWSGPGSGFDCYASRDLEHWEGPIRAFRPPAGFWATTNFWAPEVHPYRGRWYMFATFKADGVARGTQVLVADDPTGPYHPHSHGPLTPREWECLDGTLHVEDDGTPWMVFCHEWVQIGDGAICAIQLAPDLATTVGEPVELFRASQAPWAGQVNSPRHGPGHVTDGPFLHRTPDGTLLMLWASFADGSYAQGIATSASGTVLGPWLHQPEPLFSSDGGHGMIFTTFDGQEILTVHSPNTTPDERAVFIPLHISGGRVTPMEEAR